MDNDAYDDIEVTTFGRVSDDEDDKKSKHSDSDDNHHNKTPLPGYDKVYDEKQHGVHQYGMTATGDGPVVVEVDGSVGGKAAEAAADRRSSKSSKISADRPYADMGKEDLLKFSDTPFWNRVRFATIFAFWLCWLALLGAVIGLTIVAPRCNPAPNPDWWRKSVIYQIYVRSFFDVTGDGIGDIKGVTSKLEHIKSLNVSAILLSSVYEAHSASGSDFGYQVINHTNIDPTYGSMSDMDELINATHSIGVKVLLDFIPNFTGDKHAWFTASKRSKNYTNEYWNYFVWADCTPSGPSNNPNNWLSVYSQSAWTYDSVRQQCYLHQFLESQPELNLRSTAVQRQLENILRFWLDRGVDGFRVNNVAYLFESPDLWNEQLGSQCSNTSAYDCYDHSMTRSLPETYDIVARWRSVVDEYTLKTPEQSRVLVTDADVGTTDSLKFYRAAQLPINYALTELTTSINASKLASAVRSWLDGLPVDQPNATATWLTGDQDRPRLQSYVGERYANAINMLKMTLPGTVFLQYGEEIGMTNAEFSSNLQDPAGAIDLKFSRDPYRTPMQWTNDVTHAGFINESGTSQPWLPVNLAPYGNVSVSVESQLNKTDGGTLGLLTNLTLLRNKEGSLSFGKIHFTYSSDNVFSYVREHEGFDRMLVVLNVGQTVESVDMTKAEYSISIPSEATIVLTTNSSMIPAVGDTVDLRKLNPQPGEAFIARWAYKRPLN